MAATVVTGLAFLWFVLLPFVIGPLLVRWTETDAHAFVVKIEPINVGAGEQLDATITIEIASPTGSEGDTVWVAPLGVGGTTVAPNAARPDGLEPLCVDLCRSRAISVPACEATTITGLRIWIEAGTASEYLPDSSAEVLATSVSPSDASC